MSLQVPNDLTELLRNPKLLREALETIRALQNLTVRDQDGVRRPIRLSPHNATIDLGPTGAEASSGTAPVVASDLVAYWAMNESSGDAVDSVGGYDLGNSNVTYTAGLLANCAVFNGSNAQLTRDQALIAGLKFTGSFSFSFWINLAAQPTGGTFVIMGKFRYIGSDDRQYLIAYEDNGGGGYNLLLNLSANGTGSTKYNFTNTLAISTWHHIVFTFNAATGDVTCYKNGTSLGVVGGSILALYDGNADFIMGTVSGATTFWLNGKLDIVAAYNAVLTAAQVTTLYNGGAGITPT